MLEGFGQAPVCLELDLTSYDGPSHHVARFRNRSGWLMAAAATLSTRSASEQTSLTVACDEYGNALPNYAAANLLACACSLPQACNEEPPLELPHILTRESKELQRRWLRENDRALGDLTERTIDHIATMEAATQRELDAAARQVDDLRRRRRMSGPALEVRAIFDTIIQDIEQAQEIAVSRLAHERDALRQKVRDAEQALLARIRVSVTIETLYIVNWHARPLHRWVEIGYRDYHLDQGADLSDYVPDWLNNTRL